VSDLGAVQTNKEHNQFTKLQRLKVKLVRTACNCMNKAASFGAGFGVVQDSGVS
jgi:hypothetical protein